MTQSRHALIIANDHYDDQGLKKLRAPAQDAAALAEVLEDPQIGDFEVEVVRNAPADVMRRRIQGFFSDRRRDDTLMLHFSCHGLKSESGELYFAARDTEMRLLDATAVPSQFVRQCMSRTRAGRTVLFLDCCYGGAFSRGASVRAAGDVNVLESFQGEKAPGGQGWAVITASDSMEYAFEGPDLAERSAPRPSVFTQAVVEGLRTGEADRDEDGEVRLNELYDYVYEQVREENPNQTPRRTVEMQGDPWLAHSRRGRIKIAAATTPSLLQAAIDSDNPVTRLGAVTELSRRLREESLPVAEGARQALEEMARNDIGQVAVEANSALSVIRLRPSPATLDFGRVRQGSTPEPRSVILSGHPLARHCVAQSTQRWLRVEPMPNGLKVGVATHTPGHLTGDVVLKGVADETVVHVEVTVESGTGSVPQRTPEPSEESEEAVVVHTPPQQQPPSGPPTRETPPAPPRPGEPPRTVGERPERHAPPTRTGSVRAPLLAAAGLALAVTSVVFVVLAAVGAMEAVNAQQPHIDDLRAQFADNGVATSLTLCLITAVLALVLCAIARHDLQAHPRLYAPSPTSVTRSLAWTAKLLAIPAFALGVLMAIAYPIVSGYL
ncbi:caspase family protein [Streptomyces sp. A012304]|uniref:caspase family protein n=1 Tax=Streptomyces sp. A012304 TaxID=375446 RepID=UPI0022302F04|nr:caspase family protein [Streptomyces sp. A012304]GKQ39748.1 hypothetical protein ALMP_62750 [Streptomyces sp. A012304]